MSTAHEEFEGGHELDRALRAAVTGVAQLMERYARRSQEQTRETAARVREEWLGSRDAARQRYLPWTSPGRLEKLDSYAASQKWATAAAWSSMDPTARAAEQDMAQRIITQHGEHPAILIQRTDPRTLTPEANPPAKLLSMNEAYGLAVTQAPSWYKIPDEIRPLENDRPPESPAEKALHDDWQYYSESGQLPERSQWEHWADHIGRSEEFTPDAWLSPGGVVDQEARDVALAGVWTEGRDDRTTAEIAAHEASMHDAGMGHLADLIGDPTEAAQEHSWHTYLTPSRFDAATPDDLAKAWRDASAAALTGDVGAKRSAEKISTMMRERRGLNPDSMLIASLTEQAALNTEARRTAEDQVRKSVEAAHVASPSPVSSIGTTIGTNNANATSPVADEAMSRERVVELNEMAADFYGANLRPGTPGHRYFTDRLGDDFESGPWVMGYAQPGWQNLSNHLRTQGVSDQEMIGAGLAEAGKFGVRDVFRDRAMMGVRDHESGELVGFVGRDLGDDPRAPKVRNTAETAAFRKGDHVFGLHEAQPGARLVTVEGPFDAMATTLASEQKAAGVSTMGTAMTDTQAAAIAAKGNGRVWTGYDNDDAGRKATETAFYKFSAGGADVRQVDVPGTDPAEAWKERPALMRGALDELPQARSAAETVVDQYLASPQATRQGFDELMTDVGPYVADPIERQLLAARADELDKASAVRQDAEGDEVATRGYLDEVMADLDRHRGEANGHDDNRASTEPSSAEKTGLVDVDERQELLEEKAASSEHDLHAAEGVTDDAVAVESGSYDRRNEAEREHMTDHAESARDASSHGFSKSTQEQIQNAPVRRDGAAAKVERGKGVKQTHGRTLRR